MKPADYLNAHVLREHGKLDFLIKDQEARRAIIIENKINNAGDMPRQIPRYLEYVARWDTSVMPSFICD